MGPNDAVFAAVIPRSPVKNMNPDLLFRGRFGCSFQSALRDVEKKFPETQRATELIAGNDALHQNRPRVGI
jgi:hypothetical protein